MGGRAAGVRPGVVAAAACSACELGAGPHAGPAGRFGHLAYEAEVYAWLLDRLLG